MSKLQNKIALATGSARGIGAAIASAFRDEGANVILTDIDANTGQTVADKIGATFAHLDVAREADWEEIEKRFPALDVLVNNAGVTGFEGLLTVRRLRMTLRTPAWLIGAPSMP